jgi:hypothetical protein
VATEDDFVPAALPLVDELVDHPELRQLARRTYVDQLTASEDELIELEAHLLGR